MNVKVAVTGFGNVGRGLASLLVENRDSYEERYGIRLVLTGVADQGGALVDPNGVDAGAALAAKEQHGSVARAAGGRPGLTGVEMLNLCEANVFVEAASTNFVDAEPGWSSIQAALGRGVDVVLASKGALVLHYRDLMTMARKQGATVSYSATVGAPLPALEIMRRGLPGITILGFEAVVNATANVILEAMLNGETYDEGVRAAQEMGIAETDPTLDVDGWDAAAKAAILANTAFGSNLGIRDVDREGIRAVPPDVIRAARDDGDVLKLVSKASRTGDNVHAEVRVERKALNHPLGRLRRSEMGIVIHTDPLGDFTASVENLGHVSGGTATALTVLRDIFNLARERGWDQPSHP